MANNAKLALLRAKIDGQIQDLFVKTSFDHVVDSNGTPLSTVINGYVTTESMNTTVGGINTSIGNLETNKANKTDLGTLAAKNEVTEAELGEALKTLINSKAAQADLETLQQTVDNLGALGSKDKIEFSDLAEALQTLINGKADATALQAEVERATAAEEANAAAIKAVSDDYLKAADKTELSNAIKAVSDDYLKAADKTELSNAIAAEKERAEGVEAGLQTQINTIMNNPDTEGVINSINEFTQYVADHGEIAEGFRTSIAANAQAVTDLGAYVGEIPAGKDIVSEVIVNGSNGSASIVFNEPLVAGETYDVMFGGEHYSSVAVVEQGNPGSTTLYIGGENYNNSLAALSCWDKDPAGNSIVIFYTADTSIDYTLHVTKPADTTANTVVEYIDVKADALTAKVEDLEAYVGEIPRSRDIVPFTTITPNGTDRQAIVCNEEIVYGEQYIVEFNDERFDCVATGYGATNHGLYIGGTGYADSLAVVSQSTSDPANTMIIMSQADKNIEHTVRVMTVGSDAETVVEYIDKIDENVKSLADDVNSVLNGFDQLGSMAWRNEVSESDLDADLAAKVNASADANHSHDNKDVLDGITADHVASWANIATNTQAIEANVAAIAALNIKANVYTSTPSVDDIAEGQMFIELV